MSDAPQPTERFGIRAPAYASYRPAYPNDAIDAVLTGLGDEHEIVVADVGAGTGISSRMFAARGVAVIAIEPNAAMRAAADEHARVRWCDGTAERTGLADRSVDVAVACQAFHWFATPAVMNEFARIARRRAAILQYERDENDPFTSEYGEIVRTYARDDTEARRLAALTTFARFPSALVTRSEFPAAQVLTLEALLGRAASSSYLPDAGPESQAMQRDLRAAFERHQRDGAVELAMMTHVLVAEFR